MIIEKADEPRMNRACVVGALAPYNHGLPLAGADIHGFPMNSTPRQMGEFKLLTNAEFICVNPCSSVAN